MTPKYTVRKQIDNKPHEIKTKEDEKHIKWLRENAEFGAFKIRCEMWDSAMNTRSSDWT